MSKSDARMVTVGVEQDGRRLDNFLGAVLKNVPKSFIYRIIRRGEVRVNGGRSKPHRKLLASDVVRVPPLHEDDEQVIPLDRAKLDRVARSIIYEDDELIALSKPAGLAVHGGSGLRFGVIDLLRSVRPELPELELVHRLDRDTSGCLLLAKHYAALRRAQTRLNDPSTTKTYLAVVAGSPKPDRVNIDARLTTIQHDGEKKTVVSSHGKSASTVFVVRERFEHCTLVAATITSGRTHQIRVHAKEIGHPIIGDRKYGDAKRNVRAREIGLKRMFLHALSIDLVTDTAATLRIEAPLPADLDDYLVRLRSADIR